jgi:predicted transcriptional regulator
MLNRDRFYIYAEMLDASVDGICKSRLMNKVFLNSAQVNKYIGFLVANGLLFNDCGWYRTTVQGLRVVACYRDLLGLVNGVQLTNLEC